MEISNQPTATQDQSRNTDLLRLKDLLQTKAASFYTKKILRLIIEILFYLFGATILIGAFQIPMNPIGGSQELNESVTVFYSVNIKEISALMALLKVVLILFSLLFFITAYSLGSTRRKSNKIKKGYDILAGLLNNK
jgi:hypothetical protein